MKTIKLTLTAVLFLFLVSCSTTQKNYAIQASSTMAQANFLRMQYEDVAAEVNRNIATFSAQEQESLVKLDGTFKMILSRMDNIFSKEMPTMTVADANYLYTLCKGAYIQAAGIIRPHLDEFSAADKMRLEMFDTDVQALSTQIETLLHSPENKDISASLMLMGTIAGSALKIILPLVL